jgi:hypothetical protein
MKINPSVISRKNNPGVISLALGALVAGASMTQAATVYAFWAVQTQTPGTEVITGVSGNVSATTFPGTVSITRTGTATLTGGGALSFTDFQGRTWTGSGNQNTPGYSYGWGPGATGATLTVTVDLRNLQDFTLRMDVRSAGNNGAVAPTAFSLIEYSLDNINFSNAATGAALGFANDGAFNAFSLDLSSISAIEGQNNVRVRFTLPTLPTDTSVRLDNVQISAQTVPEPTSFAVLMLGAGVFAMKRRRA